MNRTRASLTALAGLGVLLMATPPALGQSSQSSSTTKLLRHTPTTTSSWRYIVTPTVPAPMMPLSTPRLTTPQLQTMLMQTRLRGPAFSAMPTLSWTGAPFASRVTFPSDLVEASRLSQKYISKLANDYRLSRVLAQDVLADTVVHEGFQHGMAGMVRAYSQLAAEYRGLWMSSALHTVAPTQALPAWYVPYVAERNVAALSRITVPAMTVSLTALSGFSLFVDVVQRIGTAGQILNPPRPDTTMSFPGMDLLPATSLQNEWHNLGTWSSDLIHNPTRPVVFETRQMRMGTEITRLDNSLTITTSSLSRVRVTETPTTFADRFMLKAFPVGDYFDPLTSRVSWTQTGWYRTTTMTWSPTASLTRLQSPTLGWPTMSMPSPLSLSSMRSLSGSPFPSSFLSTLGSQSSLYRVAGLTSPYAPFALQNRYLTLPTYSPYQSVLWNRPPVMTTPTSIYAPRSRR